MSIHDRSKRKRKTCLVPPLWLLGALVLQWILHTNLPIVQLLDRQTRWPGTVLMVFALGMFFASSRLFGANDTTIVPGVESTVLLTDGPYRFSRNPIYLAMMLLLMGGALRFGSLGPWLAVAMFYGVISWHFIAIEEAMLMETFGDTYHEYMAKVRRWI